MSTDAEELLGQLVKKIESLELKFEAEAKENKDLSDMIRSMYIWQKKMADKIKTYEEIIKAYKKTDSVRQETSGEDEANGDK